MFKYIKVFDTHEEYVDLVEGGEMILPNVTHCIDANEVHYDELPHDYSKDYLTFEALEDGTFKFQMVGSNNDSVQYSLDDGKSWVVLENSIDTPTVHKGEKIMFKQTGLSPVRNGGVGSVCSTGKFKAYGNLLSIYYGDDFASVTDISDMGYAFYNFFNGFDGRSKLVDAYNLVLGGDKLGTWCYANLFAASAELLYAPKVLPATQLASRCYNNMFSGCTKLKTAPVLPATTLASDCYFSMFINCTSLKESPVLPATELVLNCYRNMFKNCTSLNKIICLAEDISATDCTTDWVVDVPQTGTFIKAASMSSWTTGINGIPEGWTVQEAQ